jgi:hypothetical protein
MLRGAMCRDPFLTCLSEFGYSIVRLPVADLDPLEMLVRRGDEFERFGRLSTLVEPGAAASVLLVARSRPAPSISGRRTGTLDLGLGLSLLGGVIAAMGGSRIGLDTTYRAARTITFEFGGVIEDRVELAALDRYLAGARLDRNAPETAALLADERLSVATSVIRSRSLTVEARDEDGAAVAVDVPALVHAAGGRLSVTHAGDDTAAVTYSGRTPLAFGFRAVRLRYDGGRYAGFDPIEPGEAGLRRIGSGLRDARPRRA